MKARPPCPDLTEPSVLVLKEKHDDLYFHVPDEATLHKVALDILTKRLKSGDWYYDLRQDVPKSPELTKEQIEALPDGRIKEIARKEVDNYQSRLRSYQHEVEDYVNLQRAVKDKDGKAAWRALLRRHCGEYEQVRLEKYRKEYYEYGTE